MKFYPSPATESIKLDFNANDVNIKVFNVSGDVVFSKNNVSQNINIKLTDFTKGIYFFIVESKKFFEADEVIIE